jgi:hypothetical protein
MFWRTSKSVGQLGKRPGAHVPPTVVKSLVTVTVTHFLMLSDKTALSFLAGAYIVAAIDWLR